MIREASVLSCLLLMSGSFDRSGREVNYTALVYCTRDIQDKIVQAVGHSVMCIFCDTAECIMVYVMVFSHMVTVHWKYP
jgi:hypothetical protein